MTTERLASPRKIAVLHAKALGDFVMILPALTAIKQTYPRAELTLLTKSWIKDFLIGRRSPVDKIVIIPAGAPFGHSESDKYRPLESNKDLADVTPLKAFLKSMKAEAYDYAVHLQDDGTHANLFLNQLNAKVTAGVRAPTADPLDRSIPYEALHHDIMRNLETVGLIGATTVDVMPHLETTVQGTREMADILESFGGKPFIVIHPGADDVHMRWPAVKFAAVADTFTERGYNVILTGMPKEKPLITAIIQYMQRTAVAQTSLSLGGLAALLARASLMIASDTGPLHVAQAVGTRTVGIFWMPNLINRGPLFRQYHRTAVSWRPECPKCGANPVAIWPFLPAAEKNGCDHARSFVESVPISEVIALASELLKNGPISKS